MLITAGAYCIARYAFILAESVTGPGDDLGVECARVAGQARIQALSLVVGAGTGRALSHAFHTVAATGIGRIALAGAHNLAI